MAKYKLSVSSPYVGTEQIEEIEIDENECSAQAVENYLQDCLDSMVYDYISTGYEKIED